MTKSRLPSLLLIASILLSSGRVLGDDPPKDRKAKRYADLVSQLVSPNKEPITDDEAVKFPPGYDVKAQRRIDAARHALHENFEQALPYLVAALEDTRYCMTVNWADGDAYPNYSVGKVCRDVIASHLEVYRDQINFSGPRQWHSYDYILVSNEWLEARRNRSLAGLQVEAIDWAIGRRKSDPKEEGRREEIAALQKLRDQITRSGKPAKAHRPLPMVVTDKGQVHDPSKQ